jgi:hypothetical protein
MPSATNRLGTMLSFFKESTTGVTELSAVKEPEFSFSSGTGFSEVLM